VLEKQFYKGYPVKLYISYALASLLVAAPVIASHDDADKTAQAQKATQHDDEVNSAPVAKKIAQTLWKHKGKVAVGVASVIVLAALAYWYKDSLYALFVGESHSGNVKDLGKPQDAPVMPVQGNNTQTAQPEVPQSSVEKNVQLLNEVASELGLEIKTVAPASAVLDKSIVIKGPDGERIVLPVSQGTVVVLESKPVGPNVPDVTSTVTIQENTQIPNASSDVPASEQAPEAFEVKLPVREEFAALAEKQNPNGEESVIKSINPNNPRSVVEWFWKMNAHLWQIQPETPQPTASNTFAELKQISETGTPEQQIALADTIAGVQK
jgi:hypothetical protein